MAEKNKHVEQFEQERDALIGSYPGEASLQSASNAWVLEAFEKRYMYNWEWMGRPLIQLPNDVMAMAEIIQQVKPDLIIEMGIAHGGSIVFSASMLALLDYNEALENGEMLDPSEPKRKVVAVDIDIRQHNRDLIECHPMANRITMIEGSSLADDVISQVKKHADGYSNILITLDSNHTHDHVLDELRAYAPLTSKGSYCVVFDTIVEDLPKDFFKDRPWNPGNSPKSAIAAYKKECSDTGIKGADGAPLNLEVDDLIDNKLLLTAAPGGFLKRV